MHTIKIKRIYEEPKKSDGYRILVDKLWPRGMKKEKAVIDLWIKEIAPSESLRKWFNHDAKKWPEFKKRYAKELSNKQDAMDVILKEAKKKTVTLLYSAKETEHNNAIALLDILLTKT